MCEDCQRCWFDNDIGLYMCGFWSGYELVAVDSVPSSSFKENGECIYCEKKEKNNG